MKALLIAKPLHLLYIFELAALSSERVNKPAYVPNQRMHLLFRSSLFFLSPFLSESAWYLAYAAWAAL